MPSKRRTLVTAGMMTVGLTLAAPGTATADSSGPGIPNPPTAVGHERITGTDYPDASWHPASAQNYTAAGRSSSADINKIVIHVAQGSYESAVNWFQDPAAGVSAHYVVRSSDGKIAQSVRESDIAWHAGNREYNETSVGIEHEGFVDESKWFTEEMYTSSAKLAGDIAAEYDIPIDRDHIIGHSEVPGATHADPGKHWDWERYLNLVKKHSEK